MGGDEDLDTSPLATRAELQRSATRLHVALEAGRMGAWEWDVATGKVTWSPTLEAIHGLATGTFGGTFADYQSDIHPEDLERVLALIKGTLEGHDHHLEYRIVIPGGEVRWVEAHGRLVVDAAGAPQRMMGVCMDVTARKQAELERVRMTEELERLTEFRERLLGIVAHDLRNPLNAILLGAAYLQESAGMPADVTRTAGRIARSADRMAKMISELLDFTRGRLGNGLPINRTTMDVGEVARGIVEELEVTQPGRVTLVCAGDLGGAWDSERLGQLLSNLVGNALKHGAGRVQVSLAGEPGCVLLEVHNGGEPIPPEAIASVFEPFQRAASGTEGLGLGLYIVREIVRAHGGTITVTSSAEAGTTFSVQLARS